MQIEKNKKINEAIDLLIKGGVDMKNSAASDRVSKQVKLLCFFFNFIHCV